MIEMLGVLAIIGVLSAGGIMGYTTAMENHKINKTIADLQQMIVATASFFPSAHKMGSAPITDHGLLVRVGIIPQEYYKSATELKSPFGKYMSFKVYPSDPHAGAGNSYFYIYTGLHDISRKACVKLLTANWNMAAEYTLHLRNNATSQLVSYDKTSEQSIINACNSIPNGKVGLENFFYLKKK